MPDRGYQFRIVVPDGYRQDKAYQKEIRPPRDGHQMLFTINTLIPLSENIGFQATALEFFDEKEQFHYSHWESADGHIERSCRFDRQEDFKRGELYYTSLIVDARKP